uniref:Alternative protein ZNF192 n=1 Tax=Homo sapiens TaxID=9606 RepID=L8E7U6_HUMAN|nr:alternative protein ZNF192 [Homo sapiens]
MQILHMMGALSEGKYMCMYTCVCTHTHTPAIHFRRTLLFYSNKKSF